MVASQVFLLVASLFAAVPVAAEDPSADPGASSPPTSEPSVEPSAEPSVEPSAGLSVEPTPTPTPTAVPTPAPDPTAAPTPTATAVPAPAAPPTITSDKADYAPGELVTLTGSGWQPGEAVHLFVNDNLGTTWNRHSDVVADASGVVVDAFNLPDWFVAVYTVEADGAVSGRATTTFTDASLTIKRGPTGSPPNITFTATAQGYTNSTCTTMSGQSATDSATVNNDTGSTGINLPNNAGNAFMTITVPATPGPAGWTFKEWAAEGNSPNAGFPKTTLTICVRNPSGSQDDVYRANYVRATTTTASNATETFGASNVTLNATVAPSDGPMINDGTVTFTIKDGVTTIGSVTSGTVTSGAASASFSLTGVNAGTFTIHAAFSGGSGFGASDNATQSPAATLTIGKAATITTVTCTAGPFTYNGAAQTPCSATVIGPGGLNQALTVTHANNINAGTAIATAAYLETANYLGSSDDETFTIDKAATITTVICSAGPFGYDGTAKTPCVASVSGPAGLDETLTVTYANNVNAGTATASATYAESANYLGSSDSENFTIDKASTVTTVECDPGLFVYDGEAHEPCSASVTGPAGLDETLTVTYANNVNAGTATASATYAESANYLGSSDSENFTIDKADPTCSISGFTGPFDGFAHGATGTCIGVGGVADVLAGLSLGDTFIDVPGGTANWTFTDSSGNYENESGSVGITIDKADPTCSISGFTGPYDGFAHGATGSCTGVGGVADVLAGLSLGLSFTDFPGGTANWAFTDSSGNYENESGSVGITISKAPTVTTVTCTAGPFTYNGAAHSPCSATVTGPAGLSESLTVDYLDSIDAGTATASATYVESANYLGSQGSTTFTIDKADPTCNVSGYSGIFDFLPHGATGTCTGVGGGGDVLAGLSLGASFTAVPGGTANWTFTDITGNYETESGSVAIVILPWHAAGYGFYQPVGVPSSVFIAAPAPRPAPTDSTIWNAAKGGSTIPLKFNVFAGSVEQTSLGAVAMFESFRLNSCGSGAAAVEEVEFVTTGSTTLRYDGVEGQFIQNWKTPKLSVDACYRASVVFADGSSISAFFKLKK